LFVEATHVVLVALLQLSRAVVEAVAAVVVVLVLLLQLSRADGVTPVGVSATTKAAVFSASWLGSS
jgi:hypothetical protein